MALRGRCGCGNFTLRWQTVDHSLVPRACSCDFCRSRNAAYTSKSRSNFEVAIRNPALHEIVTHGSEQAQFHCCKHCGDIVCVTAMLAGESYGALNARLLLYPNGMPKPISVDYSGDDASAKAQRWRENWCYPVKIIPNR